MEENDYISKLRKYKAVTALLLVVFIGQNLFNLLELPQRFSSLLEGYISQDSKRYSVHEAKLQQLSTRVPISFVEGLFGKPKYVRDLKANCEADTIQIFLPCANQNVKREYVFLNEDYFVTAMTDKENEVVLYTITITNSAFKPDINVNFGRFSEVNAVQLGTTLFSKLPPADGTNFLTAERSGGMSGNGWAGSFAKVYKSDDYATSDNYFFSISYSEYPSLKKVAVGGTACDLSLLSDHEFNPDNEIYWYTKEEMEKRFDQIENGCAISTIGVVAQYSQGKENNPSNFAGMSGTPE